MNNFPDDDMMEMESSAASTGHPPPARPSQVSIMQEEEKPCYMKMCEKVISGFPQNELYDTKYEINDMLALIAKSYMEVEASLVTTPSSPAKGQAKSGPDVSTADVTRSQPSESTVEKVNPSEVKGQSTGAVTKSGVDAAAVKGSSSGAGGDNSGEKDSIEKGKKTSTGNTNDKPEGDGADGNKVDKDYLATALYSLYGEKPKEADVDLLATALYQASKDSEVYEILDKNAKVGKVATKAPEATKDLVKTVGEVFKKKINFETKMLIKVDEDADLNKLWNVPDFVRVDVGESDRITLKNYTYDVKGLIQAVKDNGGEVSSLRDIYFGGILIRLIETKILTSDEAPTSEVTEADLKLVKKEWLKVSECLTKVVMIVALHAYCSGLEGMNLKWYQSFTAVKGDFIQEQRLVALCKLVQANDGIAKIMRKLTVGDIKRENNVFTYRLSRLSSPGLVRKALNAMPFEEVLKYFNPDALRSYMEFDQAGILAQIASGPLRSFCAGSVNPLEVTCIPPTMPLFQLAPIDEPPFDVSTLRKVKMILDASDIPYGKWYQGMKASHTITPTDMMFNAIVIQVAQLIKQKAKDNMDIKADLINKIVLSVEGEGKAVVSDLKMWKK